ncbi:hypothetical protein [Spiroplasma poulsonii]|uniref:hypothetical protein n=1 Tax=Spiroplasma poulsonii TaxID=2138 RepID=UPI001F4CE494|nr:hypothetical protein [Spiroplasma poulsonii]UNF61394.1 hypothetical protein MNU24_05630 [Spiroplasma poulsonii]
MIILMIKLLLLMLPKLNPTQKRQNNLILVKRKTHDQNTSNYQTKETKKLLQQVFARKNMIMLYLKNQKSQF